MGVKNSDNSGEGHANGNNMPLNQVHLKIYSRCSMHHRNSQKVLRIYYQLFHYEGCLQSGWGLPFPRKCLHALAYHFILSRMPVLPTLLRLVLLEDQMTICLWRCFRKKTVSSYINGQWLPIFLSLAILSFYCIVKGPLVMSPFNPQQLYLLHQYPTLSK